jgi:hypothetical protein
MTGQTLLTSLACKASISLECNLAACKQGDYANTFQDIVFETCVVSNNH